MKRMKKVLSIVLAIAMVATTAVVQKPATVDAGVKIIAGKKLHITIGSTETIVVKGKAKAKSSSKKVAKIKKTKKKKKYTHITVQGKKVGKATIKVKVGKKSKKVKATVYPKKVTSVRAALTSVNGNTARITWAKAKGANSYFVYRSTSANGTFAKIATVKGTSYVNANLAYGNYYYYKVKACGNKNILSEDFSNTASVKTWKLVWQDEFNGTELDKTKWNNEGATGDGGYGNKELQNYQWDYQEVKDGNFIIKPQFQYNATKKVNVEDSYYSTKVWTKGGYTVQYGKIEFRAKMPKGAGTWAAGWMLGKNYNWPLCGEIDVFETTSQPAKTLIPQSLHTQKFNGMPTSSGNKHYDSTVSTATTAYHVYAVEWYNNHIRFTVDGKEAPYGGVYNPSDYVLEGTGTDDWTIWPYQQPFYLIMNCAIGGTLGGAVSPTYWTKIAETIDANGDKIETYQDYLYFDYVKVYK